eukprot:2410489-Prorocentrum_lima.AAC.1
MVGHFPDRGSGFTHTHEQRVEAHNLRERMVENGEIAKLTPIERVLSVIETQRMIETERGTGREIGAEALAS